MAPVKRGLAGALLDRLFARSNGLPPESCSYTIERLRIPVADNKLHLTADLYQPIGPKPVGTLLIRSPYGIDLTLALGYARVFAARGYQVLMNNCRGTADSEGDLDPGRYEAADGSAVVAWMRNQAWYSGSFATLGSSYMGYVQWALLASSPSDMKTAIINTGPHDFGNFIWGTGAFKSDAITWADLLTHMRTDSLIALMLYMRGQQRRLAPVFDAVPLLDAVDKYFSGNAPAWLCRFVVSPNLKDEYWAPLRHEDAIDKANIPILLTTGWHDIVWDHTFYQYSKLSERGCDVALTVGPWTHLGAGGRNSVKDTFLWLEEHLAGRIQGHRNSSVRIFVTGTQDWRDIPKWPPATASQILFLHPDKTLSPEQPPKDGPASDFKFDPANPTPAAGIPHLFDRNVENSIPTDFTERADVLTFLGEPLQQNIEVFGSPSVTLWYSSSNPNVDLQVILGEVDSKNVSHAVTEKYIRMKPSLVSQGQQSVELCLSDIAHRFRQGSRVSLYIAGGSHPRYIRNLGTGDNAGTGATMEPSTHTIAHNVTALSKAELPVAV